MLWMMFTDPDNREHMARWEPAARPCSASCALRLAATPKTHGSPN
jgi:hypothetical protein